MLLAITPACRSARGQTRRAAIISWEEWSETWRWIRCSLHALGGRSRFRQLGHRPRIHLFEVREGVADAERRLNRWSVAGAWYALHRAENQLSANDDAFGRYGGFVLRLLLPGDGDEVVGKPCDLLAVE